MIRKATMVLTVMASILLGLSTLATAQKVEGEGIDRSGNEFNFEAELDEGELKATAVFFIAAENIFLDVEIECLLVVGNVTVMTGVVTDSNDPTSIGLTALFAAKDNGDDEDDLPDEFFGPVSIPSFLDCHFFGPPPPSFLSPIAEGKIKVEGDDD